MPRGYLIPKKFTPRSNDEYFEVLAKAIFQVGFNWKIVERKWPDIHRAFHGFHLHRVAALTDNNIDRLLKDPAIIRNGRKITAIVDNAGLFLKLAAEHGSIKKYLHSLRHLSYRQRRKILVKQFKSIGPTGLFVWLYTVNEPVSSWPERNN
ncbi:MAG: DNA-3-methyladenine glycosylase I [Candidatus Kerfeldbacteria bacterium]|nr:DNA-3-methyladenine glycosylase I [Candidatus Kerfeldbacteria bacterium]